MGYTVIDATYFKICGHGLTAEQAVEVMLTYNGCFYDIIESDFLGLPCWRLYHSNLSGRPTCSVDEMVKTEIFSLCESKALASQEIAVRVIEVRQKIAERGIATGWDRMPDVMTDEAFEEMMADI